jgi:hypothetical protein
MSRRSKKRRRSAPRDERAPAPGAAPGSPGDEPKAVAHDDRTPTGAEPTRAGAAGAARQRVALAGALVVLGLVLGGVLLLGSSDSDDATAEAPSRCVQAWNDDSLSRGTGSHAASVHGYTRAWVVYLGEDFEPTSDDSGRCVVVFPAARPDPEPYFAAAILDGGRWRPMSRVSEISDERLGELQRKAIAFGNAQLLTDGSLVAL